MVFGFLTSLYSLVFHSLVLATISMYLFGFAKLALSRILLLPIPNFTKLNRYIEIIMNER